MKHVLFLHQHRGSIKLKHAVLKSIEYCLSTRADDVDRNSKAVRRRFIDFFVQEHDHTFIRSSPVVPFCDASVPFVNAGMNQFKGVFLGQRLAPCPRAVNSQKCIRVGGKHSDLELVGHDGYHHTFFEMLGNWSFNDYFKAEACRMAWELLTGPFCISPSRLYVTYFNGDNTVDVEPDFETKHIWQSIGVPDDHILPFGAADNFWEMAAVGPCGPCTEIHVDHIPDRVNAGDRVNKGFADLTELWNLVFMQYNRTADGQLNRLHSRHVDTGMGFERLIAVLQGKTSNYDTDVFKPLISAIQKITSAPPYDGRFCQNEPGRLDWAYRVLADHSRMVTVALADGMFPDQNYKLRRVLRKALLVSQQVFHVQKGLLKELTNHVADSLSDTYAEVGSRLKQVQVIIDHEEDVLARLRHEATVEWEALVEQAPRLQTLGAVELPGLVAGYRELRAAVPPPGGDREGPRPTLPAEVAFKLYDTHGLDRDTIARLAESEGLEFDAEGLADALNDARSRSRKGGVSRGGPSWQNVLGEVKNSRVRPTDDSFKYSYERQADTGEYLFPALESQVLAIVVDGKSVQQVSVCGQECSVIVDRTNFYHEAGGQSSDKGRILTLDGSYIAVNSVANVQGYVLHHGVFTGITGGSICVGDDVKLQVDPECRVGNMRNHTATHILNAAIRQCVPVTCQKSSHVDDRGLTLQFLVYGDGLDYRTVEVMEESVRSVIASSVAVTRRTIHSGELLALDGVTLLPGEVYPEEDIHLIEIKSRALTSREPCCGTHVRNTADLSDFCIVSVDTVRSGVRSVRAVTGPWARQARHQGLEMLGLAADLSSRVSRASLEEHAPQQIEELTRQVSSLQRLVSTADSSLPYMARLRCLETVQECSRQLRAAARLVLRDWLKEEMQTVVQSAQRQRKPFVVHLLRCSSSMDSVPLQKATRLSPHMPVLLLARSEGLLKARCCVPQHFVCEQFSAELWMQPVLACVRGQGASPRGQDPQLVYYMKGKKVPQHQFEDVVARAIEAARNFAEHKLKCDVASTDGVVK